MRFLSVFSVAFLSACVASPGSSPARLPTLEDSCSLELTAGWVLLDDPPPLKDQLMATRTSGKSIAAQLGAKPTSTSEAWFRSGSGNYRFCRYEPHVDVCAASSNSFVDFEKTGDTWKASGPIVTVCVACARKQ